MTRTPDQKIELQQIASLFTGLFRHTHKTVMTARKNAGVPDRLNAYPFRILGLLCKDGPMPVTEIGLRLDIAKSNVSACVNKQVGLGNLERIPGVTDRRVVIIGITEKGRQEVEEAHAGMTKVISQYFSRLSAKDRKVLMRSLVSMGDILEKLYT